MVVLTVKLARYGRFDRQNWSGMVVLTVTIGQIWAFQRQYFVRYVLTVKIGQGDHDNC